MASVVVNGDTSGAVTLSAPAVAGTVTVTLPSTSGTMAVLPTATGVLAESAGGTGTTTGYYGFKNRIINGAMVIDQRNAGAAQNNLASGWVYTADRWEVYSNTSSRFNSQQNKGAITPPAGFKNYLGVSVNTGYSVGASDYNILAQPIEGFNTSDLGFGASGASTVALSFWVYSSVTGTHSGFLGNSSLVTAYPFTFTVSSANTWTQVSVTITGSTSGTWVGATNGIGLYVGFNLGNGSNYQTASANAWNSSAAIQPSTAVSIVATSSATFYITGVQLEKGSTATSFDYRPYGTEFQLCQRYYEQWNVAAGFYLANGLSYSTTGCRTVLQYQVPKRSTTTATFSGSIQFSTTAISKTITSFSFDGASVNNVLMYNDAQTGLTTGQAMQIQVPGGGSATLTFSAEL